MQEGAWSALQLAESHRNLALQSQGQVEELGRHAAALEAAMASMQLEHEKMVKGDWERRVLVRIGTWIA